MNERFRDRDDAGRILAQRLVSYAGRNDVLVFGLPRGGVPVAFQVARTVRAPLDVLLVRKLGVPGREELAMGAIASGGLRILNWNIVETFGVSKGELDAVIRREERELARTGELYRDSIPRLAVEDHVTIVVDDGLATGSTMQVAVATLREQGASRIVVGVPVAARSAWQGLTGLADEVVCMRTPEPFYAVGRWYEDFSPTRDDEVRELLERAARERVEEPRERARHPEP